MYTHAVLVALPILSIDANGGALLMSGTVAGVDGNENLDLFGDTIEVAGAVSNLATFDATGTTSVEVAAVTTTGAQTYTGTTTLNGDLDGVGITFNDGVLVDAGTVSIDANGGALLMSGTVAGVDGDENLDLFGDTIEVAGAVSNLAAFDATGTTRPE